MKVLSPLRYPGGKAKLAPLIQQALKENGIRPKVFVEPFTGGASVSLYLLENNAVDSIGLADLDPLVSSFWKTVFSNDIEWLISQIKKSRVSLSEWHRLKKNPGNTTQEQAYACLFLNRTSFSGIIRSDSGPIGGKKQESEYKINCRFNKDELIKRIEHLHSLRDRVEFVWKTDWKTTLKRSSAQFSSKDLFFYFDPPFFEKANKLYRYWFERKNHEALRDAILPLQSKWILSYDSVFQVRALYHQHFYTDMNAGASAIVALPYSVSTSSRLSNAKEVLITNLSTLPQAKIIEKTFAKGLNTDVSSQARRKNFKRKA